MNARDFLLLLFSELSHSINKVNLMKLVLLAQLRLNYKWFVFLPLQRGGFSYLLNHECEKLVEKGILENHKGYWTCTRPEIASNLSLLFMTDDVIDFFQEVRAFGNMGGEKMNLSFVAHVYEEAPRYAIRSEILEDLYPYASNLERKINEIKKRKACIQHSGGRLMSIGYEGVSFDSYLRTLFCAGVTDLVDVRKNPISHKYGFSKIVMNKACKYLDITYHHLPGLGIESELRKNLVVQEDYDKLFQKYEATVLENNEEDLYFIECLLRDNKSVALTCFEANPKQCHRTRVANRLALRTGIEYIPLQV